jgi:hypothetical protein
MELQEDQASKNRFAITAPKPTTINKNRSFFIELIIAFIKQLASPIL